MCCKWFWRNILVRHPPMSSFLDKLFQGEICMYSELGWVDSDMAPVEEVVQEDIETLPSEMADALLGDGFDSCVTKMEEKILKKIMKDKDLGLSKK